MSLAGAVEVRRRTVLADARGGRAAPRGRRRGGAAPVVRTGLDAADAAAAAAATAASDVPGSGPTPEQVLVSLAEAIACLRAEVARDACSEWYGPECVGSDPEVDRVAECLRRIELSRPGELTPVTWQDALGCAGVDLTEENKAAFGACVLKSETSWGSVPRGTLAYCALRVRRAIEAGGDASQQPRAHSTQAWRDGLETWARAFDVFRQKWESASAGEVGLVGAATGIPMSEVARYARSYNTFRRQFLDAGGETTCEEIEAGGGTSWVWWVVGGAVVLAAASVVLWQVKTVATLASAARGGA